MRDERSKDLRSRLGPAIKLSMLGLGAFSMRPLVELLGIDSSWVSPFGGLAITPWVLFVCYVQYKFAGEVSRVMRASPSHPTHRIKHLRQQTSVQILLLVGILAWFGMLYLYLTPEGIILLAATVLGVAFGDIGGWVLGKYGPFRRKVWLLRWLSPNKTYQGYVGMIVGGLLGVSLIHALTVHVLNASWPLYDLWRVAAMVVVGDVFGDLLSSWVKRECGIKDFGASLGGHGGYADRFDGINLAVALITVAFTV